MDNRFIVSKLPMLASVALVSSLAACGGSSTGPGTTIGPETTFSSLSTEGSSLESMLSSMHETAVVNMPVGSASYQGVGAYSATETTVAGVFNNPDTLSRVKFNADFRENEISGRAYDFRSADGGAVVGELQITNGVIAGNKFGADIGGNINNRGVNVNYNGEVAGVFGGNYADALQGIGSATGTAPGYERQSVTAVFGAKR